AHSTLPLHDALPIFDKAASFLAATEIFEVHPYKPVTVGVVQTVLPSVQESVLAKTRRVMANRLARSGSTIGDELRTPHDAAPVADRQRTRLHSRHVK